MSDSIRDDSKQDRTETPTRPTREELINALRALVIAEEEYGDTSNAAVNGAWLDAYTLLQSHGLLLITGRAK